MTSCKHVQIGLVLVEVQHTAPEGVLHGKAPFVQMHAPLTQLDPDGHTLPQDPQLLVSVCVFKQVPLQTVGAVGGQTHAPFTQLAPTAHVLPQEPQLLVSVSRSTQLLPQAE
ncbi:MAG: hypothetical protein NVSMB27_24570 [Ktedonobacteraceae bacterium]